MALLLFIAGGLALLTGFESYSSLYDASYVGNQACAGCHPGVYEEWRTSPHALMTRAAESHSVVGDFANASWSIAPKHRETPEDAEPAARMYRANDAFYMSLRHPQTGEFVPFQIDQVVGYQYRQVYLTREPGGVLRRLPLQWSVSRQTFFPYWNLQEGSRESVEDLWAQMRSQNSAWNMFCARCHVTNLTVESYAQDGHYYSEAETEWTDPGISCEACHGPGSHHVNYFDTNYVNRVVAFANSKLRDQPVAYIAYGPKLTKGQDSSVCARCHGPDIMLSNTEAYRSYEPGYSAEGRINDLSPHFKEMPLAPGRRDPTVECWDDGRPKGIGMLFRSFIESACYEKGEVRCYDCHNPHANKIAREPGLLAPTPASDAFCLGCHAEFEDRPRDHTFHQPETPGAHCYDCHMPRNLHNWVGGYLKRTRTHDMSSLPDPAQSSKMGRSRSPNACNECHADESADWAADWAARWWGT